MSRSFCNDILNDHIYKAYSCITLIPLLAESWLCHIVMKCNSQNEMFFKFCKDRITQQSHISVYLYKLYLLFILHNVDIYTSLYRILKLIEHFRSSLKRFLHITNVIISAYNGNRDSWTSDTI